MWSDHLCSWHNTYNALSDVTITSWHYSIPLYSRRYCRLLPRPLPFQEDKSKLEMAKIATFSSIEMLNPTDRVSDGKYMQMILQVYGTLLASIPLIHQT